MTHYSFIYAQFRMNTHIHYSICMHSHNIYAFTHSDLDPYACMLASLAAKTASFFFDIRFGPNVKEKKAVWAARLHVSKLKQCSKFYGCI